MNHPIADGLTVDEQRAVIAALYQMVDAYRRHGDRETLAQGVLYTAELGERLARGVPDDSGWPEHGPVEPVAGVAEVAA